MKVFVFFLVMSCAIFGLTTPAHAEEQKQFQVTTKMNFPESIPAGKPVDFTIDVTYKGPYSWVKNLEPKFETIPSRAGYDVDIRYDDSLSDYTIWKGHIHTLHGTMLVSEDTPFEAVFLSVSFEGMIRFDEKAVSVDPDSTVSLSIGESVPEPENQFHEGYVEWIGRCFIVGSDVVLRVTDPDMNRDSELVEEINVTMWSDNDDRNVAYALTETGKDTGIFDANVFFTTTDSSPGKRLRIVDGSTVYAKYVDYTSSEPYNAVDVISSVTAGLSVLERSIDGSISKIAYDLCALEILTQNPDRFERIDVFYPPPLKQIKSGVPVYDIQCKDDLVLIQKHDGFTACVKNKTVPKLFDRGWMKPEIPENSWTASYELPTSEYKKSEPESYMSSGLHVDVKGQQQVRRGTTHDIAVNVSRDGYAVSDALVRITIEDYGDSVIRDFKGRTDDSGRFVFSWEIPKNFDDIKTLLAYVDVTDDISAKTTLFKFQVYCLPGETGCKVEGN